MQVCVYHLSRQFTSGFINSKLKRWCCRYAVDCTTNIRCANVASVLYCRYHVLFV